MAQISEMQQQAVEYISQQKYDEAIIFYEQCIESEPTLMANYWYLGLALLLQGKEAEAQVTWLSAMAQGEPEQIEAKKAELIELLAVDAQMRKADRDLQSALLIHHYIAEFAPGDFNNLLSLIWLYINLERFDLRSQVVLNQATKIVLTEDLKKVNEELLIEVFSLMVEVNPYHEFLEACLNRKELITALDLNVKNKLAGAQNNLGLILHQQGNFEQAVSRFQKALDINPELPESQMASIIQFNIGMGLMYQGKLEPAVSSFQKVLEMAPDFPQARRQLYTARTELHNRLKGYQFSTDWFSRNIEIWSDSLRRFVNAPEINMLEIGSWEGRSTCWLLDNILTHELAKITCIDTFEGSSEDKQRYEDSYINSIEARFDFNIGKTTAPEKVQKIVGKSQYVLRALPLNSYDIVYIDGSHLASDVLRDAILCWELVKVGGAIVFDDYDFFFPDNPAQNTKLGIDAFLTSFCDKIEVIHKSHQVIIEKISA